MLGKIALPGVQPGWEEQNQAALPGAQPKKQAPVIDQGSFLRDWLKRTNRYQGAFDKKTDEDILGVITPGARAKYEREVKRKKSPLNVLRRELTGEAKQFRQGLPEFTEKQYQGLLPEYERSLSEGTKNIRSGAASRGLLYSGGRAEKEGELRSGLAGTLAKSRYDIQREGEGMARQKEQAAASVGLQLMQQAQQRAEDYANMSMANQVARQQSFGALAGGIGYGIGAYYGSQDYKNDPWRRNPTPFANVTPMQTGPGLLLPAQQLTGRSGWMES